MKVFARSHGAFIEVKFVYQKVAEIVFRLEIQHYPHRTLAVGIDEERT